MTVALDFTYFVQTELVNKEKKNTTCTEFELEDLM